MREQLLVWAVASHVLLQQKGGCAEHGQTAVLQLLQLYSSEFGRVLLETELDLQVQWVESQVASDSLTVLVEQSGGLDCTNGDKDLPNCFRSLSIELCDDAVAKGTIKYGVGKVKGRLNGETQSGKHANSGVLKVQ